MPLGIVGDGEFENELVKLGIKKPVATLQGEIKEIERGRGNGNKEIPEVLRALIGQSALEGNVGRVCYC